MISNDRKVACIVLGMSILMYLLVVWQVPTVSGPFKPSLLPKTVAIALGLMSLVLMFSARPSPGSHAQEEADDASGGFSAEELKRLALMVGLVVLYVLLIKRIGYVTTTVIATLGLMRLMGETNLLRGVVVTAVVLLLVLAFFQAFLMVPFPKGCIM